MASNPLSQGIGRLAFAYPFSLVGLVLGFFFYFNGAVLFPEWSELGLDKWVLAYIVMQIGALAFARKQLSQVPLPLSIAYLLIGFIASYTLFSVLIAGSGVEQPFPLTGAIASIVAFQFVVASSEEVFFRGIFVRDFRPNGTGPLPLASWATIIIGALAFAAFHLAAYSGLENFSPMSFIFPVMFGGAMGYLYLKTKSISLTIGVHFSYNLVLLGIRVFGVA